MIHLILTPVAEACVDMVIYYLYAMESTASHPVGRERAMRCLLSESVFLTRGFSTYHYESRLLNILLNSNGQPQKINIDQYARYFHLAMTCSHPNIC